MSGLLIFDIGLKKEQEQEEEYEQDLDVMVSFVKSYTLNPKP